MATHVDRGRVRLATGRVRPGRLARIVDVCPGGVLVETEWRLLPGSRVELQLNEPMTIYSVKGRVVRCQVVVINRERIEYRGAVAFDQPLALDL